MKHEKSLYECFACGETTAQEKENLSFIGKLRGEAVEYSAPGFRCGVCEFQWSTGEQQALHDHAKAEVYRSMHGMVTARQLEEARANYGMDKKEFSEEFLQVSRMNYDRWLNGLIQSRATDSHLRMKIDPQEALQNCLDVCWLNFGKLAPEFRGGRPSSLEKVSSLIVSFLQKKTPIQKIGSLYLNKLLWYADQLHFNRQGRSISGAPYRRFEHGPVLTDYDQVLKLLCARGKIEQRGENDFAAIDDLPKSALEESEHAVVNEVWQRFSHQLPKLRHLSHDEEGWLRTEQLANISYELSKDLKAFR